MADRTEPQLQRSVTGQEPVLPGSVPAEEILAHLEADYKNMLYAARWDQPKADAVVPALAKLLDADDVLVRRRAANALISIGPYARSAILS